MSAVLPRMQRRIICVFFSSLAIFSASSSSISSITGGRIDIKSSIMHLSNASILDFNVAEMLSGEKGPEDRRASRLPRTSVGSASTAYADVSGPACPKLDLR